MGLREGFVRFRIRRTVIEDDARARRYGLTIENDRVEELERPYGVRL